MKRSGFQIAGGVLEIVAGAFWLIVSLIFNNFARYFGLKLDILQIIMPICFIIFGALACTGKRRKSDVLTYGILNLIFIGLQFFFDTYLGLGIVQMVLLFIASLMFFISPKTQSEIEYDKKYTLYVANEPSSSKKTRKIFIIVCCVLGLLFNAVLAFYAVTNETGEVMAFPILFVTIILSISIPLIFGLVKNKGKTRYKLTANLCCVMFALLLSFIVQFLLGASLSANNTNGLAITENSASFSSLGLSVNNIICGLAGYAVFVAVVLATYKLQYRIELNKILKNNQPIN